MNFLFKALESKYQSKIDEAIATIDLYFNNTVGVGDHADIVNTIDKYVEMLESNASKLETIRRLFENAPQKESEQKPENK